MELLHTSRGFHLGDFGGEQVPLAMSVGYSREDQYYTWEISAADLEKDSPDRWRAGNTHCRLEIQSIPGKNDLELRWSLKNTSSQSLILHQLIPAHIDLQHSRWREPAGWKLYQHGYQSWTPSRPVGAHTAPLYPLVKSFALMNHYVDSPYWGRRDGLLSSLFTILLGSVEPALLIGFSSQVCGLGEIFLRNRRGCTLSCSLDLGGKVLEAGSELTADSLLILQGQAEDLPELYAARLGRRMQARTGKAVPVGWCSWYEFYTRVTETDIHRNVVRLQQQPELGVQFVQLDDGYQTAVGDWLNPNRKFPAGLPALAEYIRNRGFQAGIWAAPFLASRKSELAENHPDWFVKDRHGKAVDCGYNPAWRARTIALDLTNPAVLNWLDEVFATLVDYGYDYFKLDFLFAGLRAGIRHDPRLSPLEAYRRGLARIRRVVGEERFLLGCGAPLGPSIGMVDGLRISEDVKETWRSRGWEILGKGCGVPSLKHSLRNTLQRQFWHRRAWLNDPDCLLVRGRNTRLNRGEIQTLVTVLGMTGGMLFLSDDLARLEPDRLDLVRKVLPPTHLSGRTRGQFQTEYPTVMELGDKNRRLLAFINWEDRPVTCDLKTWLPSPALSRFDFWGQRLLAGDTVRVAPHTALAVLGLPACAHPYVAGTSLHLTALIDGRIRDDYDSEKNLFRIRGRNLAARTGKLWVRAPRSAGVDRVVSSRGSPDWYQDDSGLLVVEVDFPAPWNILVHLHNQAGEIT